MGSEAASHARGTNCVLGPGTGHGYQGDTGLTCTLFGNHSVEPRPGRLCGCVDLRAIRCRNSSRLAGGTVTIEMLAQSNSTRRCLRSRESGCAGNHGGGRDDFDLSTPCSAPITGRPGEGTQVPSERGTLRIGSRAPDMDNGVLESPSSIVLEQLVVEPHG